ncbi:MAG TPA: GNAT family N-acetyltransferase [Bacteroidia bacterium]|nr:GNAT family N-acetyltransferase [Bacteroidia bacterium]
MRTDSKNSDFLSLAFLLDEYLAICDGDEHAFYDQYNKSELLDHVLVAFIGGRPAGCGAIKKYSDSEAEIKRMFVKEAYRNKGIANAILKGLEAWSVELGYTKCILETGVKQSAAVSFYEANNYYKIPNYEPYVHAQNSICFGKSLI